MWVFNWFAYGKTDFMNRLKQYNPYIMFNLFTIGDHSRKCKVPKG